MEYEKFCQEHQRTQNELNDCKNKISVFEALMQKIDKELHDIKQDISKLSDKIEALQKKTSEMPLKIIVMAVSIGAGVSSVLTFLILFISKISGVM